MELSENVEFKIKHIDDGLFLVDDVDLEDKIVNEMLTYNFILKRDKIQNVIDYIKTIYLTNPIEECDKVTLSLNETILEAANEYLYSSDPRLDRDDMNVEEMQVVVDFKNDEKNIIFDVVYKGVNFLVMFEVLF